MRVDDVLVLAQCDACQVLGDGVAGDGHAIAMQVAAIEQGFHDHLDAAGLV